MIKINNDVIEFIGKISKVTYFSNYTIVVTDDKKYLLKNKNYKLKKIEEYLTSIEYNYFLSILNSYDAAVYIYPYYDEFDVDEDEKYQNIINSLSILHIKTASCVIYDKNNMKELYDNISKRIDFVMKYYSDLQDNIEEFVFPKPAYYLLINNVSVIYKLLSYSKSYLDEWFKQDKFNTITSLLINNLKLDNYIVGEKNYFINFDGSYRDIFLYDLVIFYKDNYDYKNIDKILEKYIKRLGIRKCEMYLFLSLISIPEVIDFTNNNIVDVINVRKIIDYSNMTLEYILEKNKEYKKTDKDEFE